MNIANRLQRLLPGLTAKERAVQQVRQWQEGQEPDPVVARSTPDKQRPEVREYLQLVRALYAESWALVNLCATSSEHIGSLLGWLTTIHLWALEVERLSSYAAFDVPEPITRGELEARRASARNQFEGGGLGVDRRRG